MTSPVPHFLEFFPLVLFVLAAYSGLCHLYNVYFFKGNCQLITYVYLSGFVFYALLGCLYALDSFSTFSNLFFFGAVVFCVFLLAPLVAAPLLKNSRRFFY